MDWSTFVSLDRMWSAEWMFDPRWWVVLVAGVSLVLGATFIAVLLRNLTNQSIDRASALSIGLSGAPLVLILFALPILVWGALRQTALDYQLIFFLLACTLGLGILWLLLRWKNYVAESNRPLIGLTMLLLGLALLRLAFIRGLLLPPYIDSVEHYSIVNDFLHPERPPQAFYTLARLTVRYYHFGFHALAAWVSGLAGVSPADTILVLGQLLQAIIPISLFFLIKFSTKSDAGAFFGTLLAGLGWRMPAFASNWGKYPALAGVATIPFGLSVAALAFSTSKKKERWTLLVLAASGTALSMLMHTRSMLLLVSAVGSWFLAGLILNARGTWRIAAAITATGWLSWVGLQFARDRTLPLLLQPYLQEGLIPGMVILLLIPFGLKYFPRPALASLLWLFLLLSLALLPTPGALERLGYQSLLDRPFVQMTLCLPLALGGGIGLAGLQRYSQGTGLRHRIWIGMCLFLPLVVALYALRTYDFAPSPCCQLVTRDDLSAYEWIRENVPSEATILIASNRTPTQAFGVDGGIWISALTGRQTEKWSHNAPLGAPVVLEAICASGARYIYAGGTPSRFSVETMASKPSWYKGLFVRPRAYLFEITGCRSGPK